MTNYFESLYNRWAGRRDRDAAERLQNGFSTASTLRVGDAVAMTPDNLIVPATAANRAQEILGQVIEPSPNAQFYPYNGSQYVDIYGAGGLGGGGSRR